MTRKTFLQPFIQKFVQYRRSLGYSKSNDAFTLRRFERFLIEQSVNRLDQIQERHVHDWIFICPSHTPRTRNTHLCCVKEFFRYLVRVDHLKTSPAEKVPYVKKYRFMPYVFTLEEIGRILKEAGRLKEDSKNLFKGWVVETAIHLIYSCGLRVGEAMNLRLKDVDLGENFLALWKTKFHKERILPFSLHVRDRLNAYLAVRADQCPSACGPRDALFCHAGGKSLQKQFIQHQFRQLLVRCGLRKEKMKGPRLHDVRHAFAVHRLYKWYQEGDDILNKLSLLSTYMGHVSVEDTQIYFTITRALLREGNKRFEGVCEIIPKEKLKKFLDKRWIP